VLLVSGWLASPRWTARRRRDGWCRSARPRRTLYCCFPCNGAAAQHQLRPATGAARFVLVAIGLPLPRPLRGRFGLFAICRTKGFFRRTMRCVTSQAETCEPFVFSKQLFAVGRRPLPRESPAPPGNSLTARAGVRGRTRKTPKIAGIDKQSGPPPAWRCRFRDHVVAFSTESDTRPRRPWATRRQQAATTGFAEEAGRILRLGV
jgi:hypothetical protein